MHDMRAVPSILATVVMRRLAIAVLAPLAIPAMRVLLTFVMLAPPYWPYLSYLIPP